MDKIKIDLGFAVLVAEKGIDNNYREFISVLKIKMVHGCKTLQLLDSNIIMTKN